MNTPAPHPQAAPSSPTAMHDVHTPRAVHSASSVAEAVVCHGLIDADAWHLNGAVGVVVDPTRTEERVAIRVAEEDVFVFPRNLVHLRGTPASAVAALYARSGPVTLFKLGDFPIAAVARGGDDGAVFMWAEPDWCAVHRLVPPFCLDALRPAAVRARDALAARVRGAPLARVGAM